MLCHNWALIEKHKDESVIICFFHDQWKTRRHVSDYTPKQLTGRAAIIDSLKFVLVEAAKIALHGNGFSRVEDHPGPWDSERPEGVFFDARETEEGIYSRGGFWINP